MRPHKDVQQPMGLTTEASDAQSMRAPFDPDSHESRADQGELSGALQTRYPLSRQPGEEPVYRRLDALSETEGYWNVEQLEKAGKARLKHADMLRAYLKAKFSRQQAGNDSTEHGAHP